MGVGAISSKTVVGILSVLFLAATIGMWVMGGYVIATYRHFNHIASAYYTLVPAAVMIAVGIIFLFGAISGFCAAFRDTKSCSLTFFVFVFLIFALLITSICLSFVYKKNINEVVERESVNALNRYSINDTATNSATTQINYLQQEFKCCGTYNYSSWATTPFGKFNIDHVPKSCCKDYPNATNCLDGDLGKMPKGREGDFIYIRGCVDEVERFLKGNLYYLGAGAIAFLVLLILGMIGSCFVLWQRKETSYFNLSS